MKVNVDKFTGFCGCGKPHKISVKDIIIESGAIEKLPEIMEKENFKNITIICDENTYTAAGEEIKEILPTGVYIKLKADNLKATGGAVQRVYESMPKENDVLIALGSGTIHDITKYVAYNKDIPFISVPTAASVDGFTSNISEMVYRGYKTVFETVSPIYVIADTSIFKEAPYRFTASGVANVIGKYTALIDWKISSIVTGEYICNRVCNMEINAANNLCKCIDKLVLGDVDAYEQLMYALVLSGLTMQMIGNSRPVAGAEHQISNLWDMKVINNNINAYHGEEIAVGLLLVLEEYEKIRKSIENGRCSVKKYVGIEEDMLKDVFKIREMCDEIIERNTPDPLLNINKVILQNRLENIAEILAKLPSIDFVKNKLISAKSVVSLEEIGLSRDIKEKSIKASPYIGDKLTLMRLSKMLDY